MIANILLVLIALAAGGFLVASVLARANFEKAVTYIFVSIALSVTVTILVRLFEIMGV